MSNRVAVVTGANRGIGLAIVKNLSQNHPDLSVYLTARNPQIVSQLDIINRENVHFHQLDVDNKESIAALRHHMKANHGGIDVLINNAAIRFNPLSKVPFAEKAEITLKTNYFSLRNVCDALYPLLRPHARVVNMSSMAGLPQFTVPGQLMKDKLMSPDLTLAELDELMQRYVESAKEPGQCLALGWKENAYATSKVALSAMSRVDQRNFDKERPDDDIVVSHVNPGYVITDMTTRTGFTDADEGSKSAVYAATLPPRTELRGQYIFDDCRPRDWTTFNYMDEEPYKSRYMSEKQREIEKSRNS